MTNITKRIFFGSLIMAAASSLFAAESWVIQQKDADIRAFTEQVAEITGKTFVVDPTLKGQITVLSNEASSKEDVYEIFLTILDMYGYAAIETNNLIQIIKQVDVKSKGMDVPDNSKPGMDIITRVIFVENRSVMELVPLLRPMVAQYGHLAGVTSANALIITDTSANIERIDALIRSLDILNSEEIEVIPLEEAWVGNIIGLLEKLVPDEVASASPRAGGGGQIRVVADERSNAIILKGQAVYRDRIRELVKTLDKPASQNASSKVIFLNNANAAKMAELLTGFTGALEETGDSGEAVPSSPTAILADEDLNALVIRAEPGVLAEIEMVVSQLDIPRAQVMIEAAIVEVSGNISEQFAVQWAVDGTSGQAPALGGTQFDQGGSSLSSVATSAATGNFGDLGNGLILGLADSTASFGTLIQALESRSNANLLSTPSLMTLDNHEASLLVGGTVPFRTTTQTNGNGNPFETITREDVGTTLKVTPHIQNDGYISLDVEQTTESVLPSNGAVDIQTSKREITTKVLVFGGETIVLGGLIKEDITQGVSKVPILGDLPLLGGLFRAKRETREKVNLLVFIRPTVVRDKVQAYSNDKLQGIWELRMGDGIESPNFEQLFGGNHSAK